MQVKRKSSAVWNGTGKEGKGHLTSQSGVLNQTQYSFNTRFEDGIGTNPEELVAAAHAGCFTMKVAFNLQAENFTAEELSTECEIVFEAGSIIESRLSITAKAEGVPQEKMNEFVNHAAENCVISKLLNCKISVNLTMA